MTCQECELALASEESVAGVDEHLAACAACGKFAVELQSNAGAMLEFASEPMPALQRPQRQQLGWWAAIAAIVILGFVSSWAILRSPQRSTISSPPVPQMTSALGTSQPQSPSTPVSHRKVRRSQKARKPEILQVKMLTDDPDVVIYWQVSN
jgi:hypothetical protein